MLLLQPSTPAAVDLDALGKQCMLRSVAARCSAEVSRGQGRGECADVEPIFAQIKKRLIGDRCVRSTQNS
jgi:hypothetical protein